MVLASPRICRGRGSSRLDRCILLISQLIPNKIPQKLKAWTSIFRGVSFCAGRIDNILFPIFKMENLLIYHILLLRILTSHPSLARTRVRLHHGVNSPLARAPRPHPSGDITPVTSHNLQPIKTPVTCTLLVIFSCERL
jgi:hypothetical protein